MGRLQTERALVNNGHGSVADMAFDVLSRLNQVRAEQAGPVRLGPAPATPSLAPVIDSPAQPDTVHAHQRGMAAATSAVERCLYELDGSMVERGIARDIARQVVNSYVDQVERVTRGGQR